ncbi:uncharacterized protein LOC119641457 [Glossina fuscipes]|uniref:Uncharacterized protein LOC119641457 n=1 Tax=Glossina fuscipes TaxID=7396 RepID=A0A9C6DNJ1_9MUSC|nr:uncharacterized protein LOC119641457 [Glossina fuscipes]XP_037896093.1 uncharacterized protein LOC119641457 [Glossina fuscipes]XP_037896101.1 uncharacterized protein LOC119641457 [Glossina fuscipes]
MNLYFVMTDTITESWMYYIFVLLTLIPVYLLFKLLRFFGWKLFINN